MKEKSVAKEIRHIVAVSRECMIDKKFKKFFLEVFECSSGPEERLVNICKKLHFFLFSHSKNKLKEEEIVKMLFDLQEVCNLEDEKKFILYGFDSVKPILDWRKRDPRSFEDLLRINQISYLGYVKLNEMLSYDRRGNDINIHLSPSETFSVSEKISLLKRGFSKLVELLRHDLSIENIVAVSWIVTVNPGIIEKLGFTIDGPISEKEQVAFRDVENRVISRAHIKREEFLKIHC